MDWILKLREAIGTETLDCISLCIFIANAIIWPGIIGRAIFKWASTPKAVVESLRSLECKSVVAMLRYGVLDEASRVINVPLCGWKFHYGTPFEGSIRIRKVGTSDRDSVDIFPDFCEEEQKIITEEVRKAIKCLQEKNRQDRLASLPKLHPGMDDDIIWNPTIENLKSRGEGMVVRHYCLNPNSTSSTNEDSKKSTDPRPVMLTLGDQIVQITVDDLPENLKKKLKG